MFYAKKTFTANAEEAKALCEAARKYKRVLMEACHSFHHPCLIRAREIVRSGEIGEIKQVEAEFRAQVSSSDIRLDVYGKQRQLAGGAFMDTGCYTSHCVRYLTDLDFESVVTCHAKERFPGVDEIMEAEIRFKDSNVIGKVSSSLTIPFPWIPWANCKVTGTKGTVTVTDFLFPNLYHSIDVEAKGNKRREKHYGVNGKWTTYEYQLEVFLEAIKTQPEGGVAKTSTGGSVDDPIGTMELIDGVYEKSGLKKRTGKSF